MPVEWNQAGIDELLQLGGETVDTFAGAIIDAAQPPVDTGFLKTSGYVYSSRLSTFDQTWPSGEYESTKGRGLQERERVSEPEAPGDEYGAVAGWAAVYAYQIEDMQPFMYQALLSVSEEGGGSATAESVSEERETNYLINLLMS